MVVLHLVFEMVVQELGMVRKAVLGRLDSQAAKHYQLVLTYDKHITYIVP